MAGDRNQYQIIRKDAKNCFVESLSDSFDKDKAHFVFASYDLNKPVGSRQTNCVHIYIGIPELQEFCRKLTCGELRCLWQERKKTNDHESILKWLGGTSAERLAQYGKSRSDGKSLSRVAQLIVGQKSDFLFLASSGPGDKDAKGLIVPRFGKKPENHVSVSLSWDALAELFLTTQIHYEAWLAAWYMAQLYSEKEKKYVQDAKVPEPSKPQPVTVQSQISAPKYSAMPLF